jgi:NAD(P)-dependent dehydrogenase (short-subunit alcohol dehydrogenase family)
MGQQEVTPEVVVVTGASAGLGRATAVSFAKRGARLGLLARGREGLEGAKREVESAGGKALAIPTDVSNSDAVEAAAQQVEEKLGPMDVWVNNAMVSVFSPTEQMTPEEYKRVTEVNYLGTVYGTLAALKHMQPRNRGHIVQVGSALAYRGIPLQSAYCGAKHAIQGFTESLRSELLHDRSNVQLTMVQMPALNTPQFGWVRSRLPRKPQPVPPISTATWPGRATTPSRPTSPPTPRTAGTTSSRRWTIPRTTGPTAPSTTAPWTRATSGGPMPIAAGSSPG